MRTEPLSYHIFNRGVRKHKLFPFPEDYNKFYEKAIECCRKYEVRLIALSLMDNHYHALPSLLTNRDKIRKFMHSLGTSYGKYYNEKYDNSGYVFEGNYNAKPLPAHKDILFEARYIFQNPIAHCKNKPWEKRVSYMRTYKWSLYRYYLQAQPPEWLDTEGLLYYFNGDLSMFQAFMESSNTKLGLLGMELI